jgi:hypothetical protein
MDVDVCIFVLLLKICRIFLQLILYHIGINLSLCNIYQKISIKNGSVEFEYAIPYGESYLSLIGNTFFYNNGNNKFELSCNNINTQYCKSFDIVSYIVYSDHIDVTGYLNQGIDDANIEHNYANIVVDLQKQEVYSPEYTEELNEYIYVTYIK